MQPRLRRKTPPKVRSVILWAMAITVSPTYPLSCIPSPSFTFWHHVTTCVTFRTVTGFRPTHKIPFIRRPLEPTLSCKNNNFMSSVSSSYLCYNWDSFHSNFCWICLMRSCPFTGSSIIRVWGGVNRQAPHKTLYCRLVDTAAKQFRTVSFKLCFSHQPRVT